MGAKKQINTAQVSLRMAHIVLIGASGTLSVAGFDGKQVTVARSSAGLYVITMKKGFAGGLDTQIAGHCMITDDTLVKLVATSNTALTVQCTDLAGVAADADLHLSLIGSEIRFVQ